MLHSTGWTWTRVQCHSTNMHTLTGKLKINLFNMNQCTTHKNIEWNIKLEILWVDFQGPGCKHSQKTFSWSMSTKLWAVEKVFPFVVKKKTICFSQTTWLLKTFMHLKLKSVSGLNFKLKVVVKLCKNKLWTFLKFCFSE